MLTSSSNFSFGNRVPFYTASFYSEEKFKIDILSIARIQYYIFIYFRVKQRQYFKSGLHDLNELLNVQMYIYSKVKIGIPIKREPWSLNIIIFYRIAVLLIDLYRYQQKSMPIHFYLKCIIFVLSTICFMHFCFISFYIYG